MPNFAPENQQAIALAFAEAQHQHSSVLGTPHLFIALTKLDGATATALRARGSEYITLGARLSGLGPRKARTDAKYTKDFRAFRVLSCPS